MLRVNHELLQRIPSHLRHDMIYYPDVPIFEYERVPYQRIWQKLSASPYLFVEGMEIRSCSWLMYKFQSIKAWFGFTNHCQPEKISYALSKFAYEGYRKGFLRAEFALSKNHRIPSPMAELVCENYNNKTTAQLQTALLAAYFNVEPYLDADLPRLHANHRYGDSWISLDAYEHIPALDPQDNHLIARVIAALDQQKKQASTLSFHPQSLYAETAAQYYYKKAQDTQKPSLLKRLFWQDPRPKYLSEALAYDANIAKQYPEQFIAYYLKQQAYQDAYHLINTLDDPALVLRLIMKIPLSIRHALVEKDSTLGETLAKHYLEKKQYEAALLMHSNIEGLNPHAAFNIAMQEKKYTEAYDIFKRGASTTHFPKQQCKDLAQFFDDESEKSYQAGLVFKNAKAWEQASLHYLRSLSQKKTVHQLDPTDAHLEDVFTHKRLYANLLIDMDLDLYAPKDSDIGQIEKALQLLQSYQSTSVEEQAYQTQALAKGLMRRIDTLVEKIAFVYKPDNADITQQKITYAQEIAALMTSLKTLIILLENNNDESLRLKLGKAHYLLADLCYTFNINDAEINTHYKMAMQAVPDNAFYILRFIEIFELEEEKYMPKAMTQLKGMGFHMIDYVKWSDERWLKQDKIIFNIKDIHQPPPEVAAEAVAKLAWRLGF